MGEAPSSSDARTTPGLFRGTFLSPGKALLGALVIVAVSLGLVAAVSVGPFASPPVGMISNSDGSADPCEVDSTLVNSCRPWFGAWSNDHLGSTYGLRVQTEEHEARIGRKLDVVHWYHGTSDTALTADEKYYIDRPGTLLLANWKPANPWRTGGGSDPAVNARIDAMANSIKSVGPKKIFLTVFHEPENDVSGGTGCAVSGSGTAGTPAEYRAMWQNTRDRFDALGVDNVVWVMNYMSYDRYDCLVPELWPGNEYVDWVLWDPYPFPGETWDGVITRFSNVLRSSTDAAHAFTSKPWGLGEYGSWHNTQAEAYKMYDDMRTAVATNKYPSIKMYVAFDATGVRDSRVDYAGTTGTKDPAELEHYKAFANSPGMNNAGTEPEPTPEPDASPAGPSAVAYRASAGEAANASSVTLTIPPAVQAGDTMLLVSAANRSDVELSAPAGWAYLGRQSSRTLQSRVWVRTAAAADANASIQVSATSPTKLTAQVVAYSGLAPVNPVVAASASDESITTAAHRTPVVETMPHAWVLSFWAVKASETAILTTPTNVLQRQQHFTTGDGTVTSLVGDSGGPVDAESYGGLIATASQPGNKATMWSIALRAQG